MHLVDLPLFYITYSLGFCMYLGGGNSITSWLASAKMLHPCAGPPNRAGCETINLNEIVVGDNKWGINECHGAQESSHSDEQLIMTMLKVPLQNQALFEKCAQTKKCEPLASPRGICGVGCCRNYRILQNSDLGSGLELSCRFLGMTLSLVLMEMWFLDRILSFRRFKEWHIG